MCAGGAHRCQRLRTGDSTPLSALAPTSEDESNDHCMQGEGVGRWNPRRYEARYFGVQRRLSTKGEPWLKLPAYLTAPDGREYPVWGGTSTAKRQPRSRKKSAVRPQNIGVAAG